MSEDHAILSTTSANMGMQLQFFSDGTQPAILHWTSWLKEKWQMGCHTILKVCHDTEEWENAKEEKKG